MLPLPWKQAVLGRTWESTVWRRHNCKSRIWSQHRGLASIRKRSNRGGVSKEGNRFIVANNRTQPLDSFSQKVQLKNVMFYTFSGNFTFSTVELYHISFTSIHLRNVATLAATFQKHFEWLIFVHSPYSAWFQVSEGSDTVSVIFITNGSEMVRGGQG